jgi:hypothetical protein
MTMMYAPVFILQFWFVLQCFQIINLYHRMDRVNEGQWNVEWNAAAVFYYEKRSLLVGVVEG